MHTSIHINLCTPHQVWDLIVVGAGVAGSALAATQGKVHRQHVFHVYTRTQPDNLIFTNTQAGRRVLLLERDLTQPDRIVGELLQPGGYLMLKKLGLEACVDGIDAQHVYGYCMFKGAKEAKVAYPVEGYSEDVAGRSFHNGRFVQRLRQAASAQASVTVRQGTARRLINGVLRFERG